MGEEGTNAGELGGDNDSRECTGFEEERRLSGTTGDEGSDAPDDDDNDAVVSRRSEDGDASDLVCPLLTFALLFWNQICTLRDDMPSWSAS